MQGMLAFFFVPSSPALTTTPDCSFAFMQRIILALLAGERIRCAPVFVLAPPGSA